jgi:hypothetical protein
MKNKLATDEHGFSQMQPIKTSAKNAGCFRLRPEMIGFICVYPCTSVATF